MMTHTVRLVSTQVLEMARAPANKTLAALWRKQRLPSGQPPSYAEFNLNQLHAYSESLAILQPTEHGDFYYSFFGRTKGPSVRMDLTGHFHSEIDHPVADALANCFREVIETATPLMVTHGNMRNRAVQVWEELLFPVDGPFGRQIIAHAVAVAFKSDLIGAILQSSPVAVLACIIERDRNKTAIGIKIQAASHAADALFNVPVGGLVGRNPFDLVSPTSATDMREAVLKVIDTDEMTTLQIDLPLPGSRFIYDLAMTPFDGGLVLTFSDLRGLRMYAQNEDRRSSVALAG